MGGKTIGTQTVSDWFGRNDSATVMTKNPVDTAVTDFASITSNYEYKITGNTTTNLVSAINNTITGSEENTVNYAYSYDNNGRITSISTVSRVQNLSGNVSYTYDELGQLKTETNGNTTYEYAYDSKGNISSRKAYSGETLVDTDTFTYGADDWEDRLIGYNNGIITYDTIGNPTSYLGATLTWRGRELASYSKNGKQISYSYDVDGMRYQKIVKNNGTETARYDYVYSDGKLILLTHTANGTANTARFIYDSFGEPRGFILNNSSAYLYLKNGQGDITAIVDESGAVLLTYAYTAWGEITYSATSMQNMLLAATLSNVNPFTYRGYCYDYDIGMYYLQSRYYDPQICRFINADSTDYLGATGTLLSYNLFAYCENDPVDYVDATGTWAADVHAGYYTENKDSLNVKTHRFTVINDNDFIFSGRVDIHIPYVNIKETKNKPKYYGTYYWAVICGIRAENAKKIADACILVDKKYSPVNPKYQNWHFDTNASSTIDSRRVISNTQIKIAKTYFNKALRTKNNSQKQKYINSGLTYLGYALHPLQDIWAHTPDRCFKLKTSIPVYSKYGYVVGTRIVDSGIWSHVIPFDITDNVWKRGSNINYAEQETKKVLKDFVSVYGSLLK